MSPFCSVTGRFFVCARFVSRWIPSIRARDERFVISFFSLRSCWPAPGTSLSETVEVLSALREPTIRSLRRSLVGLSKPDTVACEATVAGWAVGFRSRIKCPWYSKKNLRLGYPDRVFPSLALAELPRTFSCASRVC